MLLPFSLIPATSEVSECLLSNREGLPPKSRSQTKRKSVRSNSSSNSSESESEPEYIQGILYPRGVFLTNTFLYLTYQVVEIISLKLLILKDPGVQVEAFQIGSYFPFQYQIVLLAQLDPLVWNVVFMTLLYRFQLSLLRLQLMQFLAERVEPENHRIDMASGLAIRSRPMLMPLRHKFGMFDFCLFFYF